MFDYAAGPMVRRREGFFHPPWESDCPTAPPPGLTRCQPARPSGARALQPTRFLLRQGYDAVVQGGRFADRSMRVAPEVLGLPASEGDRFLARVDGALHGRHLREVSAALSVRAPELLRAAPQHRPGHL